MKLTCRGFINQLGELIHKLELDALNIFISNFGSGFFIIVVFNGDIRSRIFVNPSKNAIRGANATKFIC
jgi:hypothetical protein